MSSRESRPRKALSTTLKLAVSAALLAVMVWWAGPDRLVAAIRELDGRFASLSFLLQFVSVALGGLNVVLLTHAVEPGLPKNLTFVAYLRSWVVGAAAPGRLGDLTLAHFLSPLGVTYGLGLATVVVDKFITFLVTVGIGALGLLLYVGGRQAALATALALAIAAGGALTIASKRVREVVRDRLLGRHGAKFQGFARYTREMLSEHPWILGVNVALTVVRTAVMAAAMWVMLLAFGVETDALAVLFVQTIAQLASWVPISMAGIGVRESTATVLYTQLLALATAPVLNANLLSLVFMYVQAAVLWVAFGFRETAQERELQTPGT